MRVSAYFPVLSSFTSLGLVLSVAAYAADLPTGGQIVAGSGSIAQSGNTLTVTQDTVHMAANWQSFDIGKGHAVNFVQPDANSVALNRVMGSDVSVIQGALNANGKVFIINPNGVTFTQDAQVNVGGLVAATQGMKTEDFMAGNYVFEGDSAATVRNDGSLKASKGGTIALIAAKIVNTGSIEAEGGAVLMGAGRKVVLDLGGPALLEVTEGALDTLIEQGGAIKADGGRVYLTAKAAGTLATSVINHTGITEAQTLATGEKGEIILMGDMAQGRLNVAGKLDASAPVGGDGGYVETSAHDVRVADGTRVTTKASNGGNGLWRIDPNDYTVAASGGNITGATLATNLGSGNVAIESTGAGGNVYINDPVAWAQNTLTVKAHNNIVVNETLNATGTGGLAFEYGLDTANGAGSSYQVADGKHVYIPSSDKFTWKKGSAGVVNNLWYGNQYLAVTQSKAAAINNTGALLQPFYYDDGSSGRSAGWYKLTYSSYPLDFALGTGGNGATSWNANGEILSTNGNSNINSAINSLAIDISGYEEGLGYLTTRLNVNVAETGGTADIVNKYHLEAGKNYIRTETSVENKSNSQGLTNVRLWVGTRDDWVAVNDSNYKTKGNLTSNGFETITAQNQQAKAIKITEAIDGTGAAILFYSISDGADTTTDSCCSFGNIVGKDPRTSDIVTARMDGSYGLFLRMNDLAAGQAGSLVWYYGAGQASQINNIISQVAQAAGAPAPVRNNVPQVPRQNAVAAAQSTAAAPVQNNTQVQTNVSLPVAVNSPQGSAPTTQLSVGSMDVVQLSSADMAGMNNGGGSSGNGKTANAGATGGKVDLFGPTRVFVVDGGVRIASNQGTPASQNGGGQAATGPGGQSTGSGKQASASGNANDNDQSEQ